jgi:hypothetical protein
MVVEGCCDVPFVPAGFGSAASGSSSLPSDNGDDESSDNDNDESS